MINGTRRRRAETLSLVPTSSQLLGPASLELGHRPDLPKPEARVMEKVGIGAQVVKAEVLLATYSQTNLGQVHEHTSMVFDELVGGLAARSEQHMRSDWHQRHLDQFSERQVQVASKHLLGVLEIAASNIATEVHRSLYPEPEKPGLLQQISERVWGKR